MKKILTAASLIVTLLLPSCTKITVDRPETEISFQAVWHSPMTRVDNLIEYNYGYENIPFGCYAWYKGETPEENQVFMDNQGIGYDAERKLWSAIGTTYYWPKTGSIDFICYSPFVGLGTTAPMPEIGENYINYSTPWNVDAHPGVDVMYADKAVGINGNVDTDHYGYDSVPVVFRHALARLAFQFRAGFTSKVAETGDITRWEIEVESLKVDSIRTTGTVSIALDPDNSWRKPDSNVWTPTSAEALHEINVSGMTVLTEEPQAAGASFLVLPQELGHQCFTVTLTIRTYRDNNDGKGERLVFVEHGVERQASLNAEDIAVWGMNQYVTYVVTINPTDELIPIIFSPVTADWEHIVVSKDIIL